MEPIISPTSPSEASDFASPRLSIHEKDGYASPSLTFSSPDRSSASSLTTKTPSVDSHKSFQLSTIQLLVVHIGLAISFLQIYLSDYMFLSYRAALTLFLATTDAVSTATSISDLHYPEPVLCADNCLDEFADDFKRLQGIP